MATYMELRGLFNDSDLDNKIEVACIVAAETIRNEASETANHVNRLVWAKNAMNGTTAYSKQMLKALLAANKDATVATLKASSDEAIQTAVDAAVDIFADGT